MPTKSSNVLKRTFFLGWVGDRLPRSTRWKYWPCCIEGRALRDPFGDLRGALPPIKQEHFASIREPDEVDELLRAIEGFRGIFVVQCALRLAPPFFVRPGELRKAEWAHFNLDKAEWRYIASKTKSEHLVPLASQAVSILRELHALTGHGRFVFFGRDGPSSLLKIDMFCFD